MQQTLSIIIGRHRFKVDIKNFTDVQKNNTGTKLVREEKKKKKCLEKINEK